MKPSAIIIICSRNLLPSRLTFRSYTCAGPGSRWPLAPKTHPALPPPLLSGTAKASGGSRNALLMTPLAVWPLRLWCPLCPLISL